MNIQTLDGLRQVDFKKKLYESQILIIKFIEFL